MTADVDASAVTQPGIVQDDLAQLTINILFDRIPLVADTDDGAGEGAVKPISPILRFPVKLSTKDAGIVEEALYAALVAGVSIQLDNSDGRPRYYRLLNVAK